MTDSGVDATTDANSPYERSATSPEGHDEPPTADAPDAPDTFHLEVSALAPGRARITVARRPWLRAAQAASVVIIVFGVLYALVLPHPTFSFLPAPPLPIPTLFRYAGQALTCPTAAAWSPDSEQFAVVDYVACDREYPFTSSEAVLAFYDIVRGANSLVPHGVMVLDSLVIQRGLPASVRADAQEMRSLRLTYTSLGWSPDGKTLAITFAGGSITAGAHGQPPALQGDPRINGLIVVSLTGTRTVRVYDQPVAQESTGERAGNPYPLVAWNTTTGQQEVLSVWESLAYRWTADDRLVASMPLLPPPTPPPAASLGRVGNPDGGASFTLWQVGYLHVGNPSCSSATGADLSYIDLGLETNGPIWSPDGAIYIPQGIYSGGRADAPTPGGARGPASECVLTGTLAELPLLPVRDAALRAVVARLTARSNVTLFWRPDGQRVLLTEVPVTIQQGSGAEYTATVYDCATGQVLATPNTPGSPVGLFGAPTVEWSPDGQRVLLLGYGDAPLTVLDATVLGG